MKKSETAEVKTMKVKRAPTAHNLFIKEAMKKPEVKALPNKERMKECNRLWKIHKESKVNQ